MADEENYGEMTKVIQRRQLIRSQLKNTVNEFAKEQPELAEVGSRKFSASLRLLNKVSEGAEHTRELQLDALGLKHLSSAAKAQALHLNDLSRGYDLDKLTDGLRAFQYDGKEAIDWTALGNATLTLACWLPTVDTMLGAVEKTAKERKVAVRRRAVADAADDSAEAQLVSKPTEVTSEDQQPAVDDSAALKRSALQLELLKELTNSSGQAAIDLIDFLVDHEDVVQTVENFFDFSFLLKVPPTRRILSFTDIVCKKAHDLVWLA